MELNLSWSEVCALLALALLADVLIDRVFDRLGAYERGGLLYTPLWVGNGAAAGLIVALVGRWFDVRWSLLLPVCGVAAAVAMIIGKRRAGRWK